MKNSINPKLGYKSARPKPKARPQEVPVVEAVKNSVPLPGAAEGLEGKLLAQVLRAKVRLLKQLITGGQQVSVSIEVHDDQWVLMVHGPNPGMKYFEDYPVFWVRSKLLSR